MKKLLIAVMIFIFVLFVLPAQVNLSAGGGFLLDVSMGNSIKADISGFSHSVTDNKTSFGVFVFFDAIFAEVDVYFLFGRSNMTGTGLLKGSGVGKYNTTELGFNVLGKYPFLFGQISVYPLVGVSYNIVLSVEGESAGSGDYNQLGILGGTGIDFIMGRRLYIRGEALLHIRLANKAMKKLADEKGGKTTPGLGPQIKIGVGYRF